MCVTAYLGDMGVPDDLEYLSLQVLHSEEAKAWNEILGYHHRADKVFRVPG